jgi:hypothetical protein
VTVLVPRAARAQEAGSPGERTDGIPAEQPVFFSNVQVTQGDDPHANGIAISLYQHDGTWFGFISEYVGPVADPPVGRLDALQIDQRADTIAFTAKLSMGQTMTPAGEWVVSRDVYEFSGRIDRDAVSGGLLRRRDGDAARGASGEHIVLRRQSPPRATPGISYGVWMRTWEMAMKARGPKW